MILRFVSTACLAVLWAVSSSYAGVQFYSSTDQTVDQGVTTAFWSPISGESNIKVGAGWDATDITLENNLTTANTGFSISFGDTFRSGVLTIVADQTVANYSTTTTYPNDNLGSIKVHDGGSSISGYSNPANLPTEPENFFLWKANNATGTFYLGWANFYILPSGVATPDGNTDLVISEWAYNSSTDSSNLSITVGDRQTSQSPTVPEPTGFAVLGLLAASAFGVRRRQ